MTAVLGAAPDAALFGPSPVARAGGRCLDVIRLLRITTASPSVEAASNRCQAVLEALRGRFDVARSTLADARATFEELGLGHGVAKADLYAGMVELLAGDPPAAVDALRAAVGDLDALSVGADTGVAAALLARALLLTGAIDEADGLASVSEKLAGQDLQAAIGWRIARAEVLAARGDLAGAVAVAEEAVEIGARTDLVIDHADACAVLAAVRASAGDAKGAEAARADAKRLYEQKGATVPAARLDAQQDPTPVLSEPSGEDEGPALENAATRVFAVIVELATGRRFDEFGSVVANDFERIDRRTTVSAAHVEGPDAWAAAFRSTIESGMDQLTVEPIALRGERLALAHLRFSSVGGDEIPMLAVIEVDERDHLRFAAWHDNDQLADAIDELDARHRALLGPPGSPPTVLVETTVPPDRSFVLENRATRSVRQVVDLLGQGRFDELEEPSTPAWSGASAGRTTWGWRRSRRRGPRAGSTRCASSTSSTARTRSRLSRCGVSAPWPIASSPGTRRATSWPRAASSSSTTPDASRSWSPSMTTPTASGRPSISWTSGTPPTRAPSMPEVLSANRAWFDTMNHFDFDAMRRLAAARVHLHRPPAGRRRNRRPRRLHRVAAGVHRPRCLRHQDRRHPAPTAR